MGAKDELIGKAKKIAKNDTKYYIAEAFWNGYHYFSEEGHFTENGIVRFEDTPMEFVDTYEEIDEDVLRECIENIL